MTHIGSGWEHVAKWLETDRNVHVFQTNSSYQHPEDVIILKKQIHRKQTSAAVWSDVILHNKDFSMKLWCDHYRFVFWSVSWENCKDELMNKFGNHASAYYCFRLEGLRQYKRRSPSGLWNPDLESDFLFETSFG